MNHFLFILSVAFFAFTSSCFAESNKIVETTLDYEEDKIYSSTECYTIIKKLGEGAFGNVYEVEDSNGGRFALKSIKNEGYSSGFSYYMDAEREFIRGQLLDHPNIIKSFDFFTYKSPDGTSSNVVLQLVEGKTLHSTVRKTVAREKAIVAAAQFCDAIHYALSLNLLHLDLHEGNVMLDNDSEVMIVDLASFFTYDEIFSFAKEQYSNSDSEDSWNNAELQANTFVSSDHKKMAPERGEKIKAFFLQNPALLEHIQKEQQKSLKKLGDREIDFQVYGPTAHNYPDYAIEIDRTPLECHYFDMLAELCMGIINKSDIEREEKINLQAEIIKLAWSFQEDVLDKNRVPIYFYLNQLVDVLNTL